MGAQTSVQYFSDLPALSQAGVSKIVETARRRLAEHDYFTLVLTGGRTPELLYENLADPKISNLIDWNRVHLFWGDERCVPPEDRLSNYHLAHRTFITKVPIPAANIHRMQGEEADPAKAAAMYQQGIEIFFKSVANNQAQVKLPTPPDFDLIMLGMGEDGHVASLFPGSDTLKSHLLVDAAYPNFASPSVPRITLTLPCINNAKEVLMLIAGPTKKKIAAEIIAGASIATQNYPAAGICPQEKLSWMIAEE